MSSINILVEEFRKIEDSIKQNLADEKSPLKLGLAVLTISQNKFGEEYLSLIEISEALDRMGIATNSSNIGKAFSRAGNKIRCIQQNNIKKYKVMIPGQREVQNLFSTSGLEVFYVQRGKPRTTRKKISELLEKMEGIVRICDPYYGIKTLNVLEMFSNKTDIRFLTGRTNENLRNLSCAISDFKTEYPNIEIRKYPKPFELHDRYIISKNELIIIGHGIKDIGEKESFIFQLDKGIAGDLINTLTIHFDERWENASKI